MTKRDVLPSVVQVDAGAKPDQGCLATAGDLSLAETVPDAHRAFVQRGIDQVRAGRFASPAEVDAVYRQFGV